MNTTQSQKPTSRLFSQIRDLFLRCDEFRSDRALRAVFADPDLLPFKSRLREANSLQERVDLFLEDIQDKWHVQEGPLLQLFLAKLLGKYPPEDRRHHELQTISQALSGIKLKVIPSLQSEKPLDNELPLQPVPPYTQTCHPELVDITVISIQRLHGKLASSVDHDIDEILVTEKQFKRFALRIEHLLADQNRLTEQNNKLFPKNDFWRANELAVRISDILNSIADRVAQGDNDNKHLFSSAEANLDTLVKILPRISGWLEN